MNELMNFLTSQEIIVVYIVAAVACLLCFVIYLIDKTYYKRKQRHNTKELNKLVEEVNEIIENEYEEAHQEEVFETPVLESIEEKLPIKPFTEEYKGIEDFRNNKVFMFSDIQKIIAVMGALFFFAVFVSEFSPIVVKVFEKITALFTTKGGL